ncbi:fumarylacetoacetate hydrolase domain-containing protein 2A isoform X2 [Drosophila busckii]|uniref:fumarylacetoacetate hydrolase domain-containing protein 2A isoform X2 n=1 Tax=Drosophila busckii TaxID=30019 RepID=UPI00083F0C49|nr:fumarylacetoacetate hydrolase domain-containing protein 2A isoform X2 [Drosophila busckii]
MKAAASLLRNIGFPGLTTKAAQLERLGDYYLPKCRFMQYIRSGDTTKQLAMVSENGAKMIELSSITCAAPDMVKFIEQRYCMDSLLENTQYMEVKDVQQSIRLLPPVESPGKIIGVGSNYYDSYKERHESIPGEPEFFVKFGTSITGALDNIRAHPIAKRIDYGCELAVVIGKKCRHVPQNTAMNYVFGYMIAQDITARDWKVLLGGQTMLGKSLDTFCPLGPIIVHKCHVPDPNNLWIKTCVNGEERQYGNTRNMIFKIDYLIHRLSQFMTLCPGDIILTGTPAGVGAYRKPSTFLKPGDIIESEIQHLGKMENKVVNPFA